jgi:hypothetical protein
LTTHCPALLSNTNRPCRSRSGPSPWSGTVEPQCFRWPMVMLSEMQMQNHDITHVMTNPCEMAARPKLAFSLFSTPLRPVLLFAQPKAALRAVEPTRGRGGRPNTRSSLLGDIPASCVVAVALVFSAGDMMLGLTEICCSALG